MKLQDKFHSMRFRLTCMLAILLLATFFLCWITNQIFLPMYYQYRKTNTLKQTYTKVYEELNKEKKEDTDQVDLSLEKWSEDNNLSIYVMNWSRVIKNGQWTYWGEFIYPSQEVLNDMERSQIVSLMGKNIGILNNETSSQERYSLYSCNEYNIVRINDERLDSEYLELVGEIQVGDKTHTIFMRSNYESIQESVQLSSRFLIYAAMVATFLGVVVMFAIIGSFTKPIGKLSHIAGEMAELKFETKYTEQRKDEIGYLGHCINLLSEKLEQTISELKVANNELQSDIENKIQMDEMRKEFLSNVSHELKTPIALIQGYAEGLQENINEDEESREFYCEVIIDEANKMNKMVKKLLNLNQIEFGNNMVEIERFDIVTVIQSVINSTRILFEQKDVTLIFEPYEPIYVWADEYSIEEVVTNYISNAFNHVDGERIIEIKITKQDGKVRISVYNTGQSIPEEDLEKVWIKFYKVDKARTREYGGSGIGLSIVKAIMNSLHQECGVRNRSNGVEFWFELDMQDD